MMHSISSREPPPRQRSTDHALKESCAVQNAIPNASDSLDTDLDHHQPTQSEVTNRRETLYASCPFCCTKVKYAKNSYNGNLCCSSCSKIFVVKDSGASSIVPQANQGKSNAQAETFHASGDQHDLPQQKRVPKWEAINLGGALDDGEVPPSSMDNEKHSSQKLKKLTRAPKTKDLTISDATLKTRGKEYQRASTEDKLSPRASVTPRVLRNLRSTRRRRETNLGFSSVEKLDARSGSSGPDPKRDACVISSSAGY